MTTPANPASDSAARYTATSDSKFVDKIRSNVKSDLIEITQDKLENILMKYLRIAGVRLGWIGPLSLFLSLLLANTTKTFVDRFGLTADTWRAIFVVLCGGALLWLIVALIRLIVLWKKAALESLIATIKNAQ